MAATSFTVTFYSADDAGFRAWGKAISDALTAVGLVQTADTGQIDWATIVRGSANVDWGYEIRRFDDPLQATAPIYLKIGYGAQSSVTSPQISVQVGKGTDGAGTITEQFFGRFVVPIVAFPTSPQNAYVAGGDGSFITLAASPSIWTSQGGAFSVERSRDAAGAPTGDAVTLTWATGDSTSNAGLRVNSFANRNTSASGIYSAIPPMIVPGSGLPLANGAATAPAFPVLATDTYGRYWLLDAIKAVQPADVVTEAVMPLGGKDHVIIPEWRIGGSSSAVAMAWW